MAGFVRETFKKFYSSATSPHSAKPSHFVVSFVVHFVVGFVVDVVVSGFVVISVVVAVVNVSIHRMTPILIACPDEYAKE